MYWDRLSSPQLDALDRQIPVILPVAAIEQHGPHLPLATDRLIGEHFMAGVEAAMSADVLILPTLAVGCSAHHMAFAGTLSLSHDTFAAYADDVLSTVTAHGFQNIVLANSHGGNRSICGVILERFGDTYPECRVVLMTWWTAAAPELMPLNATGMGGVGHACEFETSLMLCIAPELVHRELIAPRANLPTFAWADNDMLRGSRASLHRNMDEYTANGAYGDPAAATAEKGQAITAAVIAAYTRILGDLRRARPKS